MRMMLAALVTAAFWTGPAQTQEFHPDAVDEAMAKREGVVTWYTSTPVAAAQYIANEFQKRTGIKVELLRTGGQNVLRRFQQEADGHRIAVDVITMSDMSAANDFARRGLFVPFKPVGFDKVIPAAKDPDGNYIAQRLTLVGMLTRTDKVAEADRPKTWTDLTAPKYKGLLVMADPAFTAIQLVVVATLSQKLGWSFYEGLRRNDTLIVQGHEQIYDMVKRGERLVAAEVIRSAHLYGRAVAAEHDQHNSSERRDPGAVTDRDHQGLAAPECGQAVRAVQLAPGDPAQVR